MISVGLDLSALDPNFKSHAQRGIGRYVAELHRFFESGSDPRVKVGFFDHEALRRNGLTDKLVSFVPCGRTSLRQHLVYPRRLNEGAMREFSLLHYPAHMDAPAWTTKPYVLTVLDLIPLVLKDLYRAHKPGWRFKIARSLEVLAIKRATLLLAISETTAQDLVRVLDIPRERIVVTPLGVDERFFKAGEARSRNTSAFAGDVRFRLGIPRGRPIILYVGGHDERKNIGNLVGIAREVRDDALRNGRVAPLLVIAGRLSTSIERERLEQTLRRHEMTQDTVNLGYVGDDELLELYTESSLFLFPSLYEGFGLPALEAMAAGLPVVASNTSSIPEVVGAAGELFDPLSISAGAKAVLSVLNSEDRQASLSRDGIARARGFTWERTGRATIDGYVRAHELLAGISARSCGETESGTFDSLREVNGTRL